MERCRKEDKSNCCIKSTTARLLFEIQGLHVLTKWSLSLSHCYFFECSPKVQSSILDRDLLVRQERTYICHFHLEFIILEQTTDRNHKTMTRLGILRVILLRLLRLRQDDLVWLPNIRCTCGSFVIVKIGPGSGNCVSRAGEGRRAVRTGWDSGQSSVDVGW